MKSSTGYNNAGNLNTGNLNTGNHNTGHWNMGNWNTGSFNAGNHNTGHYNTGNRNTGNYNTGSHHVGWFNSVDADQAYYFNKLGSVEEWEAADKPDFIDEVNPTTWVFSREMTDKEKQYNPDHEVTGGYLRQNDLNEEWRKAYDLATDEDKELLLALPNFDADVFEEITGIDVRDDAKDLTVAEIEALLGYKVRVVK